MTSSWSDAQSVLVASRRRRLICQMAMSTRYWRFAVICASSKHVATTVLGRLARHISWLVCQSANNYNIESFRLKYLKKKIIRKARSSENKLAIFYFILTSITFKISNLLYFYQLENTLAYTKLFRFDGPMFS